MSFSRVGAECRKTEATKGYQQHRAWEELCFNARQRVQCISTDVTINTIQRAQIPKIHSG